MADRGTQSNEREALVHAAVGEWTAQLVDLSRRNPFLYFRDLATGTLDLGRSNAPERARLLGGSKVRASRLFPDEGELGRARKSRLVPRISPRH